MIHDSPIRDEDLALDRTILLLRDHVPLEVSDARIGETLRQFQVALVADAANLGSEAGQQALVTSALLMARSGASIRLEVPDLRLQGVHVPLQGEHLQPSLMGALHDLLPGVTAVIGATNVPDDLVVVLGDTPWLGDDSKVLRVSGDAWCGSIERTGAGSRWQAGEGPFGPLAAAGLVAGEAFKVAVGPLREFASHTNSWDAHFAPAIQAKVRMAPAGTQRFDGDLGDFDCVSGGAISQAMLFALARVRNVRGTGRVIEPETGDISNLNRYAFLRRSHLGAFKAVDLASWLAPQIAIKPVIRRFDEEFVREGFRPASAVLVGVDDIPSRWHVQAVRPRWLGVGATSHYSAMASFHIPGWGCAQCLHPHDEPGNAPIPTVAFVSHWAGLWLAIYFVRMRAGQAVPRENQSVYMSPLRPESSAGIWSGPVPVRDHCPQVHSA